MTVIPQTGGIAAGDAFWFSVVLPRSSWPRWLRVAGSVLAALHCSLRSNSAAVFAAAAAAS